MMIRLIVATAMMFVGMAGTATAAIITATVNCRSAPATTGRIVAKVEAGTAVTVLSRLGTWRLVDQVKAGCWVASRYVQEGDAGLVSQTYNPVQTRGYAERQQNAVPRGSYSMSRPRTAIGSYARRPSTSRRRRSAEYSHGRHSTGYGYSGGSCPCSGSNICIGPRGGRYRITNGGNKRYGV